MKKNRLNQYDQSKMKRYFKQKIIVLVVLFLGYLGYSLVFPILPPLFINPEFLFLPAEMAKHTRLILLGFAFGMYPFGQFIGCPVIGKLSDMFGRKPLLVLTLFLCSIMYVVTALAVKMGSLFLLFSARFFTGLCEGNIVIATTVMSDVSVDYKAKAKNFGWIMTFASSAWIFGPLIGGSLADAKLVSWFTFSTPFWLAACVFFFCFLAVAIFFKETIFEKKPGKMSLHHLLFSSFKLLKKPSLRNIYITNTLFYVATFIFFTFLPILLIKRFHFSASEIGVTESYLSIAICLAPFTYRFYKHLEMNKPMAFAGFGGAFGLLCITIPFPEWILWLIVIIPSYFIALGFSYGSLLISEASPPSLQGEALGLNQACQVLTEAVVAVIGGSLIALSLYFPFILGIAAYLCAGLFALISLKGLICKNFK